MSAPPTTVTHHTVTLWGQPLSVAELDRLAQWVPDRTMRGLRFPDPVWAVPGLLREGLAVLVSAPKLGKSWLALQLAYAVALGGVWIGRPLGDPAPVLNVMAEDTLETLQERCVKLQPLGLDDADIPLAHSTMFPGNTFVERFAHLSTLLHDAALKGKPYKLVIIDTLELFRGEGDPKRNAYREDVSTLKLLRALALESHCTILLLHHTNKIKSAWDDGGDPFEAISGSNGISGTANTILIIQRARSEPTGVLHVGGHRVKDQKIPLRFDVEHGAWTVDGDVDPDTAVLSGAPRAILDHLTGHSSSLECLVDALKPFKKEAIKKALQRLAEEGKVANVHGLWIRVQRSRSSAVAEPGGTQGTLGVVATGEPAGEQCDHHGSQAPAAPAVDDAARDTPPAHPAVSAGPAGPVDIPAPRAAEPGSGVLADPPAGPVGQAAPALVRGTKDTRGSKEPLTLDISDLNPKRAIPVSMDLMLSSIKREQARYHPSLFAAQPDEVSQVWEGRHRWDISDRMEQCPLVRLDKVAAYLGAANTALPIGPLKPSKPRLYERGVSGIHQVEIPSLEPYLNLSGRFMRDHVADQSTQPRIALLGSPLGNREEPGLIWITTPTLKLLCELHEKYPHLGALKVAAAYTAPATEVLLRPWIDTLRNARRAALELGAREGEPGRPLYEFVKACYSKTVSTMGESNANWEICRPDWMRTIRAQAYVNVWKRAWEGTVRNGGTITPVKIGNTDEVWVVDPGDQLLNRHFGLGRQLGQWDVKRRWIQGREEA